jgi:DNA-binding response OmpR family regulator
MTTIAAEEQPTQTGISQPGPSRWYRSILVVEDEDTLRRIIVRNLAGRGHLVREAATAAEALTALAEERPDLLLMDINLPDRTGWDVLRDMRQQGWHVPVVIVSACHVGQARLHEFRPLAYLPKPFPLEALLRIVREGPARSEEG